MTKREKIYALISEERDYQDKRWGGASNDKHHSVADWIIFMEIFLDKAKHCIREDNSLALAQIVKVTALGVACLENSIEDEDDTE